MAPSATEHTPLRDNSSGWWDTACRVRLLTIVASLAEGYDIGIMTNALGPIEREFRLTPLMVGIVVSSALWAAMFAAILAGSILDSIGRKVGIAIASALICCGNVCWAFAMNVIMLVAGRTLMGLGIGTGITVITVYMAEVAPVHRRGMYVSMETLFLDIGVLLGFVAGAFIVGMENDWRIMVGIGALLPLICSFFALTPYLPESPRFLQAAGRVQEAREVLLDLLNGDEQEVDKAFATWAEEARTMKQGMDWSSALSAMLGSHFRVFVAGIGIAFFTFASGMLVYLNYSVPILMKNGMSSKSAGFAMIVVGIVKTAALVLPVFFLMDRWGRRPLLLTGAVMLTCGCSVIAFGNSAEVGGIWIAVGLGVFAVGFSLGFGPVCFVYISEVFDNSIRAKGASIAFFVARFIGAMSVLLYPVLSASLGITMVFCILAAFNASAFVFVWFFCPETLGVALEDMNRIFKIKSIV